MTLFKFLIKYKNYIIISFCIFLLIFINLGLPNIKPIINYNINQRLLSEYLLENDILLSKTVSVSNNEDIVIVIDNGTFKSPKKFGLIKVLPSMCQSTETSDFISLCDNAKYERFCTEVAVLKDDCNHGEKVASLIGGINSLSPGTSVLPFQIYSFSKKDNSFVVQKEDFTNALKRILDISNKYSIKAINISFNTEELFATNCNEDYPEQQIIVNELNLKGIKLFVSSGNNGNIGKVAYPACFENVYNIASIDNGTGDTKKNKISDFSNANKQSIFQVGRYVSVYEDGQSSLVSGTSYAAPIATSYYLNCIFKNTDQICIDNLKLKFQDTQ